MRYLVTGATGYIGSKIVQRLLEEGHQVTALCRSAAKANYINHKDVRIVMGDVTHQESIRKAMQKCDYVFHSAAYTSPWAPDAKTFFDVNVTGTVNVLESALENQVRRIVFTSTGGVFGYSGIEDIITEEYIRADNYHNEYEGSKALAESKVKDYVIKGLDIVIVNPTRVYGPYILPQSNTLTKLIERFVNGKWFLYPGVPDRIGNYVYIDDVVTGHLQAMKKGRKGSMYLLGGENHSYKAFFDILREVSGVKRKLYAIHPSLFHFFAILNFVTAKRFHINPLITPKWMTKITKDWKVSSEKAQRELDYPVTPLSNGLEQTIQWIRQRDSGE